MAKKIQNKESEDLATFFLKSFVEKIIHHKNKRIKIEKEEKLYVAPLNPMFERSFKKMQFPQLPPQFSNPPQTKVEYISGRNQPPFSTQRIQPRLIEQQFQQTTNQSPVDKIAGIFRNPAVSMIECAGPGKNIIVTERGLIRVYPISLSKEEIEEILEHFSEETKIPLIQGVFKAAYQNILITAVISEIVGTRFLIQKRIPPPIPPRYR